MTTIELSVFDQWIPSSYIPLLHIYPIDPAKVKERLPQIHSQLTKSLHELCSPSNYPWLAGTVRGGTHIVIPTTPSFPEIYLCDHPIEEADLAGFSNGDMEAGPSFNHNYVSPIPIDPMSPNAPVLYAQLTAIHDGVVLCISIHHKVADAHGLSNVINAWATLSRTGNPLKLDNDRGRIAFGRPLNPAPPDPIPLYHRAPGLFGWEGSNLEGVHTLTLFYSEQELSDIRRMAQSQGQDAELRISTRDALTAHIWRCLSKAEAVGTTLNGDEKVSFGIAADVRCRAYPRIPDEYVGCCITYTVVRDLSLSKLLSDGDDDVNDDVSDGLKYAGGEVRKAVMKLTPDLVDRTVGWFKAGKEEGWLGELSPGWEQGKKPVPDYSASDWSRNALYEADFGFGAPALVVPPKVFSLPGLIITTCPPPALAKDGQGILLYAHLTAKQYAHLGPNGDMADILHLKH